MNTRVEAALAEIEKAMRNAKQVYEEVSDKSPWPRLGDTVYALTGRAKVIVGKWGSCKFEEREAFLGIFKTADEAVKRIHLIKKLLGKS